MEEMNQNTGNKKSSIKKYLPVSALILLTICLMLVFRHNKRNIGFLIESGKKNLIEFYARNLKPLFETTDISNEDVFNFALYQSLPIDKQNNKVLTISDAGDGKQVYEIKSINYNPKTNNYQRFVKIMGLNSRQKEEADSILNVYKKELYLSVLMNDKNTVAVSSKISELQKAILADLLNFVHKIDPKKAWEIFPEQGGLNNQMKDFIAQTKEIPQNEFVFITPDTAFKAVCNVDTKKAEKAIQIKMKIADSIPMPETVPEVNWNFDFHFQDENLSKSEKRERSEIRIHHPDSNFFKVVFPGDEIENKKEFDDIVRGKLNEAAEKLKRLSISFEKKNKSLKKELGKLNKEKVELYFQDPTQFVEKTLQMVAKQDFKNWDEFGKKMDSVARSFAGSFSDSVYVEHRKTKTKTRRESNDSVENNQNK
jgi:hypothetical protein